MEYFEAENRKDYQLREEVERDLKMLNRIYTQTSIDGGTPRPNGEEALQRALANSIELKIFCRHFHFLESHWMQAQLNM